VKQILKPYVTSFLAAGAIIYGVAIFSQVLGVDTIEGSAYLLGISIISTIIFCTEKITKTIKENVSKL